MIKFNRHYSTQYLSKDPDRVSVITGIIDQALLVTDKRWRNFNPRKPISMEYASFDSWAFTGLAYRLVLIAACAYWLFARQPKMAVWTYAFAAAAQVNDDAGFRSIGLAAIALWTMAALATAEWPMRCGTPSIRIIVRSMSGLLLLFLFMKVGVFAFSAERQAERAGEYQYHHDEGDHLARLSCAQSDVSVGVWPDDTSAYWYSSLRPISGYLYLWPWVADFGLSHIITELSAPGSKSIVVLHNMTIWDRWDTRNYLAPLRQYLDGHFTRVEDGTWISPALAAICGHSTPRESHRANHRRQAAWHADAVGYVDAVDVP